MMLSCRRRRKTTSCQQPTRESPILCCLDVGTKLFCSNPRVFSTGEIYSMLSLSTFLTKATRQELSNRSLPSAPEAEVHLTWSLACFFVCEEDQDFDHQNDFFHVCFK